MRALLTAKFKSLYFLSVYFCRTFTIINKTSICKLHMNLQNSCLPTFLMLWAAKEIILEASGHTSKLNSND